MIAVIGAGGMGQVYRARDTRLQRDVAIKTLPDAFTHDRERVARFQREAQVLASLNDPGIAQIYGIEESDGTTALLMELVEGPTLAERIDAGPVPLDDVLLIARRIADALSAAHAQGIVRRDLKPANVKVRPDGTVKILTSAWRRRWTGRGRGLTSPTRRRHVAGNAARRHPRHRRYMAPEQGPRTEDSSC